MSGSFVVLTGMHASGKSTAAAYLASLGYLAHAELGWALRQHHLRNEPETTTLTGDGLAWFDRSILDAELQRDSFLAAFDILPHCVETWHLGNLAYASVRSPDVVPEFEAVLVRQVRRFDPLFIHLRISGSTFHDRCSLPDLSVGELYGLYTDVHTCTVDTLRRLSLRHTLIPNDGSVDDLHGQLHETLRREAMHAETE